MQMGYVRARAGLTALSVAILVTACGGGGGDAATAPQTGSPPQPGTPSGTNHAPTISGSPGTSAQVGQAYSFQPTASDSDGDTLTYTVANKPAWLVFNTSTGRLNGTPASGDVGSFAGITITVSDGKTSANLGAFAVAVSAASATTGSATLSWTPPTQNSDGSSLTNLAGYKVLYGRSASALDQTISLTNPSLNTYQVDNLGSGTWFFAIVTVNAAGGESVPTNVASVVI
jgi:hypothetical protein